MKKLNQKLSAIMRVVVHPKYRTIGLGIKLVKETLPLAPNPCAETIPVMARYNPFFEKAGMQKIAEQPPARGALAIADTLSELGSNIQFLGSERYVLEKLQTLKAKDITLIKEAFYSKQHATIYEVLFRPQALWPKETLRGKTYENQLRKARTFNKSLWLATTN